MADRLVHSLREELAQPRALKRVGEARIERVDVRRQLALAPEVIPDILVGGEDVLRIDFQVGGDRFQEERRLRLADAVVDALVGEQARIVPARLAVLAPVAAERPARQRLAGVPLTLAVVEKSAGRVMLFKCFY